MFVTAVGLVLFTLISIQFFRIVSENVAMARTLAGVEHDVATLTTQKRNEQREIRRLLTPQGSIPEIHERLRLVAPNETIVYVKQSPRR